MARREALHQRGHAVCLHRLQGSGYTAHGGGEAEGKAVRIKPAGRIDFGEIQYRPEVARPRNGLMNVLVRRAMLQATDRQTLSEAITEGYAPVAHSYTRPTDPWQAETDSAV